MNAKEVMLDVENPNEPPRVFVHYEMWDQEALWLSGKYGYLVLCGSEIGLPSTLVDDLRKWVAAADALADRDDPPNSRLPEGHFKEGLALAQRVRAELPADWIVTTIDPSTYSRIVLPLPV